ncbi:MAG: tyrosine-type recombinase/integrase [Streptosporangiaceae bacterium]
MTARARRSPGEGSVWAYKEKNGTERWAIGHPSFGTRRRGPHGEKWFTKRAAQDALRAKLVDAARGELVDPSRQPCGDYLDEWLAGLRLAPSTLASYRKNMRLHVKPRIGSVPLASLTTERINAMYRELERSGRADHREGEGLSPRTVRYVHTILSAALAAAVKSRRLARNPAATATPPTAKQAKAPEMHPWDARQLGAFLDWSKDKSALHVLWTVLAMTGMRRGEALALRWRDIDLDAGTASIRRSAGVVRVKGEGAVIAEGDTKSGKPRVIDLDAATVALLRAWKRARGAMALQLARDDALVFGDHEGSHRHPERVSRTFRAEVERCRKALGDAAPPRIRLHDLRHTHATLLLAKGVPVKVVSERLGHASATITLQVYAHVMPGNQRDAAALFASLVTEAGA